MTRLVNEPTQFVEDALAGFAQAHSDHVRPVEGGFVRARPLDAGKVAVIVGGGSGHYPAFAGLVGYGFAAAAVCGNIFASPSAAQATRVARAAERGGGVVFAFGNYAGDVLHFGLAQERLRADGLDVRSVLVTDDVASAPSNQTETRRGIAGDFVVFKVMSAAAERGDRIDDVERLGRHANDRTRTLGVAFGGCNIPGAIEPLFTVPEGMMSIGLGIHGEPGIRDVPVAEAAAIANLLLDGILQDVPAERRDLHGQRVTVLVNGLGSVKYEELYVLYNTIGERLVRAGAVVVAPECGEFVTSLDLDGVSVTLVWLDQELEELWCAPAHAPGFRRQTVRAVNTTTDRTSSTAENAESEIVPEPLALQQAAPTALAALRTARDVVAENEKLLGQIDAVAGDGDHGAGMLLGLNAATSAARRLLDNGAGLSRVLADAGEAWADRAGGTSGALWGAALMSAAASFRDSEVVDATAVVRAVDRALDTVRALGGAQPGDKTLVDAFAPFAASLREHISSGVNLTDALVAASRIASTAADATAELTPLRGRARPLAERSLGHPDAGAVSFAMIVNALAVQIRKGQA